MQWVVSRPPQPPPPHKQQLELEKRLKDELSGEARGPGFTTQRRGCQRLPVLIKLHDSRSLSEAEADELDH